MALETTSFVVAFAVLLFFFGLISRKISGTVVTAPMIFVAVGMLLSPEGLDFVDLSPKTGGIGGSETVSLAVIMTVFLSVFVQGATAGPGSERYARIVAVRCYLLMRLKGEKWKNFQ